MRIFVTGFMAAGKSTVGRLLATRLGTPFVDLDGAIEEGAGLAVGEIFERWGEARFRRLEAAELRRVGKLDPCVVATGGGTPIDDAARAWMRSHGRIVWLDVPFAELRRRLGLSSRRPLYRGATDAEELWSRRLPAYRDCDLAVAAGGCSAADLAARIAAAVRRGDLR